MNKQDNFADDDGLSPERQLLYSARHGQVDRVAGLLQDLLDGRISLDVNCKGDQKWNRGWNALHLAAYFGHLDIVKLLLENGADVNMVNNVGDSALHRASYTGRMDMVMFLLGRGADVSFVNAEGYSACSVARTKDIQELIEAAIQHGNLRLEEEFLAAVRWGEIDTVQYMLKSSKPPNLNCTDAFGNTALHVASQAGRHEAAVLLLQNGAQTSVKNKNDKTPVEVATTAHMKQILGVRPIKDLNLLPQRCEGELIKKSRFLSNQVVWVILDRGVLSYFKSRGDANTGTKRRGFKYMDEARILIPSDNHIEFVIHFSDGTVHRLGAHPDNGSQVSRQKWLNALQEHTRYSSHYLHQGELLTETEEDIVPLGTMQDALQMAQAHHKLLEQQIFHLSEDMLKNGSATTRENSGRQVEIYEKVDGILKSSHDMCMSLNHCMTLFYQQEEVRKLQLKEEQEKSRVLQESLHALAIEHHELEKSVSCRRPSVRLYDTDNDEFYDCSDDSTEDFEPMRQSSKLDDQFQDVMSFKSAVDDMWESEKRKSQSNDSLHNSIYGRNCLPVPMFDRNDFSFWSILKQCIGKELSKITMPVVFNEPLTFIQRLSEYMEYAELIEKASLEEDPIERMKYVSAFAVSAISSNWERIGKPFNPLLGETFELDRPDLGFKLVSEQVSHHPPVSAFYVESPHFKFHGSILPKLKFWGKSVEVTPKGVLTLELTRHGEVYTWQNVNCCVHNVIVGKLWVEHYGVMEVVNLKSRYKSVLNFKQGGWFGKDLHKVEGFIYDEKKNKLKALYGSWIMNLIAVDADVYEKFLKNMSSTGASPSHTARTNGVQSGSDNCDVDDNIPVHTFSNFDLGIPGQQCIWKTKPRPPHSDQYFSFSSFAMSLNEITDNIKDQIPPTDSRLRPDARLLEQGQIDGAADEKHRLEEKQRAARKDRKKLKEEWTPLWFKYETNPHTGKEDWIFDTAYWKRSWERCREIF